MFRRDIEGENPLYLQQAKVYDGSCALGHAIVVCEAREISDVPIRLKIERGGATAFEGGISTATMKRTLPELAEYLTLDPIFRTAFS